MRRPEPLKLFDCSTGHLSLATREHLGKAIAAGTSSLGAMAREEGFFIGAGLDTDRDDIAPDLKFIMKFAQQNHFDYILFDRDADMMPFLPWYGDSNSPDADHAAGFAGMFRPAIVAGKTISAIGPWLARSLDLHLPPAESRLEDGDYILEEDGAWFTIGEASVRVSIPGGANGDHVSARIFPLGFEGDEPVGHISVSFEDLEAQKKLRTREVESPSPES